MLLSDVTSSLTDHPFADDIYRDDVVFKDPRNTLRGKKNYKRIFKVGITAAPASTCCCLATL